MSREGLFGAVVGVVVAKGGGGEDEEESKEGDEEGEESRTNFWLCMRMFCGKLLITQKGECLRSLVSYTCSVYNVSLF